MQARGRAWGVFAVNCPRCKAPSESISLRAEFNLMRCGHCGHEYRAYHQKLGREKWKKKTDSGSGQKAGPITIGAGFRWGSTRLG
jgi:Zn ribbon nucleic-acid-binding protein